jgi:hypothetical protein
MELEARIEKIEEMLEAMIQGERFIKQEEMSRLGYMSMRAYNALRALRLSVFTYEAIEHALTERQRGIGPTTRAVIARWWEAHMQKPMDPEDHHEIQPTNL